MKQKQEVKESFQDGYKYAVREITDNKIQISNLKPYIPMVVHIENQKQTKENQELLNKQEQEHKEKLKEIKSFLN